MANKPINQITIIEICELADVNRGTFYKHYTDQYNLLKEIQDELDSEIKAALDKNLSATASSSTIMSEMIRYFASQSALCKVVFSKYGDAEFLKRLMYNAHDKSINEWKTKAKRSGGKELEMFYTFIANGIAAVIQGWIDNDMEETPQEIAVFIEKSINSGLGAFVNGTS